MNKFQTIAIPFTLMGNRQVLTSQQLVQHQWLADFVSQFKDCFEADLNPDVLVFYPKGKPLGDLAAAQRRAIG